jgi:SAM-dependent methyltransferase
VPQERWRKAQEAELAAWRRQSTWHHALLHSALNALGIRKTKAGDDWNQWWYDQFDGYRVLPDQFQNAIELGCGPYTNIRLIRRGRFIGSVVCSDPLALHYLRLARGWLETEHARGTIVLDAHPIEECTFPDGSFDLVVLINVLDHVRDAMACLDVVTRIAKPDGFLILGQDLSDKDDAARVGEDVAHPIRIHHGDLDTRLLGSFTPLFQKILPREKGRNPEAHYGTYLLIGRKTGSVEPGS